MATLGPLRGYTQQMMWVDEAEEIPQDASEWYLPLTSRALGAAGGLTAAQTTWATSTTVPQEAQMTQEALRRAYESLQMQTAPVAPYQVVTSPSLLEEYEQLRENGDPVWNMANGSTVTFRDMAEEAVKPEPITNFSKWLEKKYNCK